MFSFCGKQSGSKIILFELLHPAFIILIHYCPTKTLPNRSNAYWLRVLAPLPVRPARRVLERPARSDGGWGGVM